MAKHYIRVREDGVITKIFSSAFEDPKPEDICVNENGDRHFNKINGKSIIDFEKGKFLFKWEYNQIFERSEEEILADEDYKRNRRAELKDAAIGLKTKIEAGIALGFNMSKEQARLNNIMSRLNEKGDKEK